MIKIRKLKTKTAVKVYDITVPDTKNFYANDIVVHNCSEISLPSSETESFVCCLSSINLQHWDAMRETDVVETMVAFLDAVMSEFITKTTGMRHMEAAHAFARNHRALGLGVLGYHDYLQEKNLAWESMEAGYVNLDIFSEIRKRADAASEALAARLGEPPLLVGYGRRNTTTLAIAPTTSCVVPETTFLDGDGNAIDYYEFCRRGGLDLTEIMKVEIQYEDGTTESVAWDTEIEYDGKKILAYQLADEAYAPTT